jgi:hypothetical protein
LENQGFSTKIEIKLAFVLTNKFWEFKWSPGKETYKTWRVTQTPWDDFKAEFELNESWETIFHIHIKESKAYWS